MSSFSDTPPEPTAQDATIFVTGVNTYIGSNLLKIFEKTKRYKNIIAVDYKRPSFTLKKAKFHKIDFTSPVADEELFNLMRKERCDTLLHLNFLSNPSRSSGWAHELEVIGTLNVINAAQHYQPRKLIMRSSTMVYGALPDNPNFLTEEHPLRGKHLGRFIKDKIEADEMIQQFGRRYPKTIVTILRVGAILGPRVDSFITRYLSGWIVPHLMGFDPLLQFVHEEDVVRAFIKAIDEDHPGIFNIIADGVLPLSVVLNKTGRLQLPMFHPLAYPFVGLLWTLNLSSAPSGHLDFLRYIWVADGTKAMKQMGFKPKYSSMDALDAALGTLRLKKLNLLEAAGGANQ